MNWLWSQTIHICYWGNLFETSFFVYLKSGNEKKIRLRSLMKPYRRLTKFMKREELLEVMYQGLNEKSVLLYS